MGSQANIECSDKGVILSGGRGYRFADCLTVQHDDPSGTADITDMDDTSDVRNDDVPNVRDDAAKTRREWILQQLKNSPKLQAPDVAEQFKCSVKTAQRDLKALKEEKRIEFVGTSRTGYYRLRELPETK